MGRKKLKVVEEHDDKDFEAVGGNLIPEWWNEADRHQTNFAHGIEYSGISMVNASAGTGKTTIAVMKGFELLRKGQVDILRYVRFVDRRTLKMGFLPGDEEEKQKKLMLPFYEAAAECGLSPDHVEEMRAQEILELSTDIHWRGRNMKRTFLIIDEAQNGDIEDMRMMLTRLHDSGKGVVVGHSEQCDNKLKRYGREKLTPFEVYIRHMVKERFAHEYKLVKDYRGEYSRWADRIYETIKELEDECKTP